MKLQRYAHGTLFLMRFVASLRLAALAALLMLTIAVPASALPARAADAPEFWREPADLPFDVTVLEQGVNRGMAWQVMVYTSEIYRGEPMRIFAYYVAPAAPGKYPGVVHIHGGGGTADFNRAWAFATAGYACLSFDWNTFGDPVANWKAGDALPAQPYTVFGNLRYDYDKTWNTWGKQFFAPQPDEKGPVLYRAVMAARRALTWLGQRPEVEAEQLVVEGHSWGGFMAQLLAGIDPRVKAAVAGASTGGWESRYREKLAMHLQELTPAQMQEWVRHYDPASYADRITAPLLVRFATTDFFASVDSLTEYWPKIPGSKSLQLTPGDNHFAFQDVETRVAWFNHWLKEPQATPAFPKITEVTLKPGEKGAWTVRVRASTPSAITKGSVVWTTAPGAYNSRAWAQRPLSRAGGEKTGDADAWTADFTPVRAGGPLRVFVSVRDANGRVVSSLPIIQPLPPATAPAPAIVTSAPVRIARVPASPLVTPDVWKRAHRVGPIAPGPEVLGEQSTTLDTLWHADALYVRVRVDDSSPWVAVPAGTDFWYGDSVHLRLRTEARAGQTGVPDTEQNVLHLAFYPDPQTGEVRLNAVRGKNLGTPARGAGAVTGTVAKQDGAGYTLTLRIPWRFMDSTLAPRAGRTIRFGLQTVYGDLLTDNAAGAANFNNGHLVSDPESWGQATLVE